MLAQYGYGRSDDTMIMMWVVLGIVAVVAILAKFVHAQRKMKSDERMKAIDMGRPIEERLAQSGGESHSPKFVPFVIGGFVPIVSWITVGCVVGNARWTGDVQVWLTLMLFGCAVATSVAGVTSAAAVVISAQRRGSRGDDFPTQAGQ